MKPGITKDVETLIHGLQNHESRKILYCSELTLMRMPHDLREQVVGLSDLVTANCNFQTNVFKYVERAYESHFVRSGARRISFASEHIKNGNRAWLRRAMCLGRRTRRKLPRCSRG